VNSKLSVAETSIVIVVSEFNQPIIENLLQGALDAFAHHGGKESGMHIHRVPGAFEIPGTIVQIMKNNSPDAIVALGAVIRGETPHFDYIAGESAKGIAEISRSSNIPIINGILTTDNTSQAEDRSQVGGRNKGWDAMEAALQTINVYQEIFSASKC
jgi:6,7-dimethyl-8-ribityllumazine synthase